MIIETNLERVDKIVHISDIHIRKHDRHNEYRVIFGKLYRVLESYYNANPNMMVVITGDIMHDKTDIVPESLDLLRDFIVNISNICEVVLIVGNHDVNIFNIGSMDCLQPIITDLYTVNPVHLLKENDIYSLYNPSIDKTLNIRFGLTNIWASKVTPVKSKKNVIDIALYHGTIHGATIDTSDHIFSNSSMFNCTDFKKYDIVMLGDIHKFQFLNVNKTIAYPGSLIQQNRGESLLDHGYILWDVKSKTGEFHRIRNEFGFLNVIVDDTFKDISNIEQLFNYEYLPKNLDIKLTYNSPNAKKLFPKIYRYLTNKGINIVRTVEENGIKMYSNKNLQDLIRFSVNDNNDDNNNDDNNNDNNNNNTINIDQIVDRSIKNSGNDSNDSDNNSNDQDTNSSSTNINVKTNYLENSNSIIDAIMKYYDSKHNKTKTNTNDEVTNKNNSKYSNLLKKHLKEIMSDIDYQYDSSVKNIKLVSLEFDNMFIYLKGNKIDFSTFDKIVGLNAKNYRGKSSLIDVILYSIYGKCSRGKRKDMLNFYRKTMRSKIVIEVNNVKYTIVRDCKLKSGKSKDVEENIMFYKGKKNITSDTNVLTNKSIEKNICSYTDMVLESFVLCHGGISFVEMSDREKKDILCKIAGLEVFDNIFNIAKSKHYSASQTYGKLSRKLDDMFYYHIDDNDSNSKDKGKTKGKKVKLNTETKLEKLTSKIKTKRKNITKNTKKLESTINKLIDDKMNGIEHNSNIKGNYGLINTYCSLNKQTDDLLKQLSRIEMIDSIKIDEYVSSLDNLSKHKDDKKIKYDELNNTINNMKIKLHNKTFNINNITDFNSYMKEIDRIIENTYIELNNEKNSLIEIQKKTIEYMERINANNEIIFNFEHDDEIKITYEKYVQLCSNLKEHESKYELLSKQNETLSSKTSKLNKDCAVCMSNVLQKAQTECINSMELIVSEMNVVKQSIKYLEKDIDIVNRYEEYMTKHNNIKQLTDENRICMLELKNFNESKDMKILRVNRLEKLIENNENDRIILDVLSNMYVKLDTIHDEITNINDEIDVIENIVNEYNDNNRITDEICIKLKNINDQIEDVKKNIDCDESLLKILPYSEHIDELKMEKVDIETIDMEIEKNKNELRELRDEYVKINYDYCKLKEIRKELKQSEKMKSVYDTIKKLLNTSGIVDGILSQSIIPYLEASLNGILSEIGHYSVAIEYYRSSVRVEKIVNNNKLSIVLNSGYESYLFDLVFRLALAQINNNIRTNFIVIDEGFGKCDDDSKLVIKKVLEYMKAQFKWLLIVSHDKFIKSFYDMDIRIQSIVEKGTFIEAHGSFVTNVKK